MQQLSGMSRVWKHVCIILSLKTRLLQRLITEKYCNNIVATAVCISKILFYFFFLKLLSNDQIKSKQCLFIK